MKDTNTIRLYLLLTKPNAKKLGYTVRRISVSPKLCQMSGSL